MMTVTTENLNSNSVGGVAGQLLANGLNINALRTNRVLRKDEWIMFDEAVVSVARQRLNGLAHLMERGLTLPITNALGITRVEWENMSHLEGAEINMSGLTETGNDRVEYSPQSIPLPLIHKDFFINLRNLEASRNLGMPLDTTQAQQATRLITEAAENMLFNGANITSDGSTIYGYTTAPNRNIGSLVGDWSNAAVTGEQIVKDVLSMMAAAEADHYYGPYGLYVPIHYYNRLLDDYKANSDRTILERIMAVPGIDLVAPTEFLTGNNVVLVTFQTDVVDLIEGFGPTMVDWTSEGGFRLHFKVMTIMVPRVKSDAKGQSGIVHFSI